MSQERIDALEKKVTEVEALVHSLDEERHIRSTLGERADMEERLARIERERNDMRVLGCVVGFVTLAFIACALHYELDVGPSARSRDRGPLPVLDGSHPAPAP